MYMTNIASTELDLLVEILYNPTQSVVNTMTTLQRLVLYVFFSYIQWCCQILIDKIYVCLVIIGRIYIRQCPHHKCLICFQKCYFYLMLLHH